ncbi:BTB/POZ domain-containing protein [Aspergillus puulaauensis]|uniref:BTB domain-containing protein n=1 Tax=Aspergillus puulaauensis TaxID=1220207 RepID=A0A7R7XM79_9EURO|nr:uncharacterized protein APUU_31384S [Aspergillus puulaauensis]BCS23159.1 hypothetical protein APUU_31384S [Aspergillus puulaauensis]
MRAHHLFQRIAENPRSVDELLKAATTETDTQETDDDPYVVAIRLMSCLVEAASQGSIEIFRLLWPAIIKAAEYHAKRNPYDRKVHKKAQTLLVWAYQCAIEASFAVALVKGYQDISQHILYHFKNPFYGWRPGKAAPEEWREEFRSSTLTMLLRHAAAYGDMALVQHILNNEDIKPKDLESAICSAAREDCLDTVEMIVAHLMTMEKGDPRSIWGSAELGRHPTIDEQRLEVVGFAFTFWPSKTRIHGQRILLGLFFKLVHVVYVATPDCEDVMAIRRALQEEWALLLSREQCFKFLEMGMPPKIRASMFKNLRAIDHNMPPDSILIKTDGEPVVAHKDILCYWSKYFAGLSRHAWADNGAVDFGYHIHPAVMTSVLNFMYCGEYVDVECDNKQEFLSQLWEAADYLQIDLLKEKVGLLLDQVEEEEEEEL